MALPLVAINILLFAGLALYALVVAQRVPAEPARQLWRLLVLPAFAVVVGGLRRLAVQAVQIGWLHEDSLDFLLVEWQIGQSVVVAIIGLATVLGIRRVAHRFARLESVAGAMLDRIKDLSLDSLDLTPRERQVLEVLGASTLVDNKTLAENLGVSTETVHSHISALLRKTKLSDRRDLALVAYLQQSRMAEDNHRSR